MNANLVAGDIGNGVTDWPAVQPADILDAGAGPLHLLGLDAALGWRPWNVRVFRRLSGARRVLRD